MQRMGLIESFVLSFSCSSIHPLRWIGFNWIAATNIPTRNLLHIKRHLNIHRRELVHQIPRHIRHGHQMARRARLAHMAHHYASLPFPVSTLRHARAQRGGLLLGHRLGRRGEHASALIADHREMPIRRIQQSFMQQKRRAVRDDRVALHLAEPDSAVALSPLQRLPRQLVDRSVRAHLRLVAHLPLSSASFSSLPCVAVAGSRPRRCRCPPPAGRPRCPSTAARSRSS